MSIWGKTTRPATPAPEYRTPGLCAETAERNSAFEAWRRLADEAVAFRAASGERVAYIIASDEMDAATKAALLCDEAATVLAAHQYHENIGLGWPNSIMQLADLMLRTA